MPQTRALADWKPPRENGALEVQDLDISIQSAIQEGHLAGVKGA